MTEKFDISDLHNGSVAFRDAGMQTRHMPSLEIFTDWVSDRMPAGECVVAESADGFVVTAVTGVQGAPPVVVICMNIVRCLCTCIQLTREWRERNPLPTDEPVI